MNDVLICQSCAMPLASEEDKGTNKNGSISDKYCMYCFQKGEFTNDMTLEEMINDSVNYAEMAGMSKEEMLNQAKAILPTLERWRQN